MEDALPVAVVASGDMQNEAMFVPRTLPQSPLPITANILRAGSGEHNDS